MKFMHAIAVLLAFFVACSGAEASQRRSPVVIAVEKVSPTVANITR